MAFASIDDVFRFDYRNFNISPREAEAMDPHHRLMLESVWSCIEDAGYAPDKISQIRTGVFIAVYNQDFGLYCREGNWDNTSRLYLGTGSAHCFLPNRISYLFNFQGSSEVVDTACSSSLVAVHRAVQAIRAGECDQAIAGGVSVLLDPERIMALKRLGLLSNRAVCHPFDKSSFGQVMGEGVGSILIKRLSRALPDGDHIYGTIKGSGVNHRGRRSGRFTLPDAQSQIALIDDVYARANISLEHVSYIEGHGAGGAGDVPELAAIRERFSPAARVGSVTGNIGSLEAAGGLSQVIKTLMSIKYGVIPATFNHLSSHDQPADLQDRCPVLLTNLATKDCAVTSAIPFTVGVHAYGLSGVNAHVIVQEYASIARTERQGDFKIVLSGVDGGQLRRMANDLLTSIDSDVSVQLSDVAYTLDVGRQPRQCRASFRARSREELLAGLHQLASADDSVLEALIPNSELSSARSAEVQRDIGGTTSIGFLPSHQNARRISLPTTPLAGKHFPLPNFRPGYVRPSVASSSTSITDIGHSTVERYLHSWLENQIGLDESDFSELKTLSEYGIDSVGHVALCEELSERFGVRIPPTALSTNQTLSAVTGRIKELIGDSGNLGVRDPRNDAKLTFSDTQGRIETDIPKSVPLRAQLFQSRLESHLACLRRLANSELAHIDAQSHRGFSLYEDFNSNLWLFLETAPGNTFDVEAIERLSHLIAKLRDSAALRAGKVLYLSHFGASFSLGGDRKSFLISVEQNDLDSIRRIGIAYNRFLDELFDLPMVTVGVVYGSAQGGGMELLMALDYQIVWPDVKLGFPEIKSGLLAGMGGLTFLTSIVGAQRALQLNLTGELIESQQAATLGLISRISSDPFGEALKLTSLNRNIKAALEVRKAICRRKFPLLRADIENWIAFVCSGQFLDCRQKIELDFAVINNEHLR